MTRQSHPREDLGEDSRQRKEQKLGGFEKAKAGGCGWSTMS